MIDLSALHVFCRTAHCGGVGAAARELRITQPAVSQRLRKLERDLGRKLYGKAGRRLVLTEDGRRLYEACRQAFDSLESAEASLKGGEESALFGTVRIAALSELSKTFLLPQVRAFRSRHPGVAFDILYQRPYEIFASLSRHEADFVLTNEPYRRPQVEMIPAFKEKVVCVGPAPSRRLSWDDVCRLPWMSYGAEDPLWFELQALAAKRRVKIPEPSLRVADVDSLLRLAADGAGYALAPEHSLGLRALKGLAVHRLPFPPLLKQIYLCRLRTVPMARAARAFWERVIGACASLRR